MALEGMIQDFGLTDIIQFLRQQTKTGVLSIQSGEERTKVYFKDGLIVSAATAETEGVDWLVQRLLRSGYVSEPQLKQVLEQYPDPGRFVAGLQESGLITQQDLKRFFEFQTKETLFTLFRLKEGTYRFEPTPFDNPQYDITPHDPNFILLEGMRQLDEWPMIKKKISSENTIFEKKHHLIDKVCISQEDEIPFGEEETEVKTKDKKYGITGTEMAVYQLVNGRRNVQQLVDRALIGEFYTYKALGSLVSQGLIDPVGEAVAEVPKLIKTVETKEETINETIIKTSSVSKVWSTVLFAFAFAWGIIFAPGLLDSLLSFPIPAEFLEDKINERNALELEEAIIIFYYKNTVLPMTLKELMADIPETQSLMDKLSSRGLRYYLEDDGFYLKISYNL